MVQPSMLKKYALFGGLTEEQIENILLFMQEEKFEQNEILITEGNYNDKIYFLIEGQVNVTRNGVLLARFVEGENFGEIEVLDVMPASASIKADSSVSVLSLSNTSLRDIYKKDAMAFSLMIMNLARDLCRRLRRMDEKLTSSTTGDTFLPLE